MHSHAVATILLIMLSC